MFKKNREEAWKVNIKNSIRHLYECVSSWNIERNVFEIENEFGKLVNLVNDSETDEERISKIVYINEQLSIAVNGYWVDLVRNSACVDNKLCGTDVDIFKGVDVRKITLKIYVECVRSYVAKVVLDSVKEYRMERDRASQEFDWYKNGGVSDDEETD